MPERVELTRRGRDKLVGPERSQYKRREIAEGVRTGAGAAIGLASTGFLADQGLHRLTGAMKSRRENEVVGDGFQALRSSGLAELSELDQTRHLLLENRIGKRAVPAGPAEIFREVSSVVTEVPGGPTPQRDIRVAAEAFDNFLLRAGPEARKRNIGKLGRVLDDPLGAASLNEAFADAPGVMTSDEFQDIYQRKFRGQVADPDRALRRFAIAMDPTLQRLNPALAEKALDFHSKADPGMYENILGAVSKKVRQVGNFLEGPLTKKVRIPRALVGVGAAGLLGGLSEGLRNRGELKKIEELQKQTDDQIEKDLRATDRSTALALVESIRPERSGPRALRMINNQVRKIPGPTDPLGEAMLRANTQYEF